MSSYLAEPGNPIMDAHKVECACSECRSACQHRPGWFMPGEAEKAAAHLGMTLKEFFAKHLAVDWLEGEEDIFLLAPAIKGEETGEMYPGDPRGACNLLVEGKCSIHEAKPMECAVSHHSRTHDDEHELHIAIGKTWADHQGQVRELLGRAPEAESYTPSNVGLFGFFGGLL